MTKEQVDEALHKALKVLNCLNNDRVYETAWVKGAINACEEALEQEERTQRTMYCGTADAFIAMDDDHKRRWFVQSLRESKRRKELEDILEQPAQEPVAYCKHGVPKGVCTLGEKDCNLPAPWQGLSDDEISKVIIDEQIPVRTGKTANRFARAIEQALKEKNT